MKRTILTPQMSAWLNATFDRNRGIYGGLRMMADDDGGKSDDGGAKDDKSEDADDADKAKKSDKDTDDDKPLGPAGEKALEAERKERKALKAELDGFKTALGTALGIKSEGDKDDEQSNLLASVQNQIKDMQREAAVLRLANAHRITDEDDLALLASAKDDEAMKRLAERLAPGEQEDDDKPAKGRRPKPDRTQGGGAGTGDEANGVNAGRDLFKASRSKKSD